MLRFVLIHDGTELGWQTAYRAFHVAARLGASLLAVVIDSRLDADSLAKYAAEIKVGGNAARINLETHVITDFTEEKLFQQEISGDGLFLPRHLAGDGEAALRYLKATGFPEWIISTEEEIHKMAVLLGDQDENIQLISYARSIAKRLQKPLAGLYPEALPKPVEDDLEWLRIRTISGQQVKTAILDLEVDLLLIPESLAHLLSELAINVVIVPS